MIDRAFNLVERLLGLAEGGLTPRELAFLAVFLLLIGALGVLLYVRRMPVAGKTRGGNVDAAAPYRSQPPVTIHVNGNSTSSVHVGGINAGAPPSEPPRHSRASQVRSYRQLRRIAALPGDDEEFTVS